MNTTKRSSLGHSLWRPTAVAGLLAGAALGTMLGTRAYAESEMFHPTTTTEGGVVGAATITKVTPGTTSDEVCWYGMQGWYTIEAQETGKDPVTDPWTPLARVAASDFSHCATVTKPDQAKSYVYRLNQSNAFAGSGACSGCHGNKAAQWKGTAHSSAYATITNLPLPAAVKETCFPCHTVGMGQQTGYKTSDISTLHLTDVGCENCHGPAAWHKYSDHELIRPAVSIDPKICGGCHTDSHHPTYDEWKTTLHAEQNSDIRYGVTLPAGVYETNIVYYSDQISVSNNYAIAPTPNVSSNAFGYLVYTNIGNTNIAGYGFKAKTNYTTGIIHSGNMPGDVNPIAGTTKSFMYQYDPGNDRAVGCGICHSAATRMVMLNDYEARLKGYTNTLAFAEAHDAGEWTSACATCHDPHSAENPAQLRNPKWSTNYYTMPTTADKRITYSTNSAGVTVINAVWYSAAFANMYNPDIQVCGQCHNSRGGRWDGRSYGYYIPQTDPTKNLSVTTNGPGIVWGVQTNISYSRGPHHSPQYNLLIGNIQPDYLNGVYGTNVTHAHGLNTDGCAACHMAKKTVTNPDSVDGPNYTGHEFEPNYPAFVGCSVSGCHDGVATTINATNQLPVLQNEITNGITAVVLALNNWATVKGPGIFGAVNATKYGKNGWEYTTAGDLGVKYNNKTAGPSASDQLLIPEGIRQARFDLYNVSYGKSLGVHNPNYARFLLNDASNKVWIATQP